MQSGSGPAVRIQGLRIRKALSCPLTDPRRLFMDEPTSSLNSFAVNEVEK